jgi:hypothetical protein
MCSSLAYSALNTAHKEEKERKKSTVGSELRAQNNTAAVTRAVTDQSVMIDLLVKQSTNQRKF